MQVTWLLLSSPMCISQKMFPDGEWKLKSVAACALAGRAIAAAASGVAASSGSIVALARNLRPEMWFMVVLLFGLAADVVWILWLCRLWRPGTQRLQGSP